jgi:hypothetical protein
MTLQEELALRVKRIELKKAGKIEEANLMRREIPLAPHLAKFAKDYMGVDFLRDGGWNLSKAEAEFGKDWLSR